MLLRSAWAWRIAGIALAAAIVGSTNCTSSSSQPPPDTRPGLYATCDDACSAGTCVHFRKKYPPGFDESFCSQPCGGGCPQGECG